MLKALLKKIRMDCDGQDGLRVETAEDNSRLFLLRLAMVWNQFDFARDIIFPERGKQTKGDKETREKESKVGQPTCRDSYLEPNWTAKQQLTIKGREKLMRFAIEYDRIDFIKEFLQKQNFLKAWLTASELIYLYNKIKNVIVICFLNLKL